MDVKSRFEEILGYLERQEISRKGWQEVHNRVLRENEELKKHIDLLSNQSVAKKQAEPVIRPGDIVRIKSHPNEPAIVEQVEVDGSVKTICQRIMPTPTEGRQPLLVEEWHRFLEVELLVKNEAPEYKEQPNG